MHIWTHLKPAAEGKTGIGVYPDGMVEHDGQVGELLAKLDELGIADNTIVIYTTDNGAEVMSWPDGGTTPFRGEKNTNWEGGYRVPAMVRWPGVIKPGTRDQRGVLAHEDMMPTLLAAAGETGRGGQAACRQARSATRPTRSISTATTCATFLKARHRQRAQGVLLLDRRRPARRPALRPVEAGLPGAARPRLRRLGGAVRELRLPKLFNLRGDPFERADHEGMGYPRWRIDRAFMLVPAQVFVSRYIQSLVEFPPRQKPGSFNLQGVLDKLKRPPQGVN